jgi:hypothetical protein
LLIEDATRYNIEPFFWSSSLSWIPSRFQEEIQPGIGDRKLYFFEIFTFSELTSMLPIDITITLTFLRSMANNHDAIQLSAAFRKSTDSFTGVESPSTRPGKPMIDPHSPLVLQSSKCFHNMLANYNHSNV